MSARSEAEQLIVYYLRTVWERAGLNWTGDNEAEAEQFVDHLIEAAREGMQEKAEEGPASSYCPAKAPTERLNSYFVCTKGVGHDGPHEAGGSGRPSGDLDWSAS